ncbi:CHAT domain-containing protein [[Phormidium] sp. ETS-05]|uniref:CHAT domain-containing protein n=1 Tax=[Phormidium] sp. ETS-05 TaxID=222819 RepID=UPI00210782D1|nr:CHAT domain-containing protein [[Phormidium] sp. ETS-05]
MGDQKLTLDRLSELRLYDPPVDLLVLSACHRCGDEQSELGFAGLAVQAGVKTALASLWYVSDEGTLTLMTEFYHILKQAPIKAEALRQAQIAMIKNQARIENGNLILENSNQTIPLPPELANQHHPNLQHPYYWAAFTMIGSPW